MAANRQQAWLRIIRAPGLGGARGIEIIDHFGGAEALLRAGHSEWRKAGIRQETATALSRPDEAAIEADQAWLQTPHRHLIPYSDDAYPALLKSIPSPPVALFAEGNADLLWQPQLGIIGSRNPTAGGCENARDFSRTLAAQGLTITSGMAAGIDSEAHRGALDAGGNTIAVVGTGPDRVYPARGARLAEEIRARGLIVSELPPGTPAQASHFPSRNRIISGLSLGVLVIEAALRSGTLITARHAAEQGREVFALPGSIHNPLARGCHRLIREGVRLAETTEDILSDIAMAAGGPPGAGSAQISRRTRRMRTKPLSCPASIPNSETDPDYLALWHCLAYDPRPVDRLIEQSGLTAQAVSAMLLMLELKGMAEAHRGGSWSRKKRGR